MCSDRDPGTNTDAPRAMHATSGIKGPRTKTVPLGVNTECSAGLKCNGHSFCQWSQSYLPGSFGEQRLRSFTGLAGDPVASQHPRKFINPLRSVNP